jgi:PTS system N-acetylglucosamine-specific IIA component
VISLFPHAFIIEAPGSRAVLVHAGIDTVELEGEGFETLAAVGAAVEPGQELIRWDPAQVAAKGLSPLVPVIATQAAAGAVELLAAPGGDVAAGAPLLTWA